MDETSIEAIRTVAQQEVEIIVAQSLRSGTDVLVALEGARLMHREALVWIEEAIRREREKRQ